jgi:hypothetical protein
MILEWCWLMGPTSQYVTDLGGARERGEGLCMLFKIVLPDKFYPKSSGCTGLTEMISYIEIYFTQNLYEE